MVSTFYKLKISRTDKSEKKRVTWLQDYITLLCYALHSTIFSIYFYGKNVFQAGRSLTISLSPIPTVSAHEVL